MYHYLVFRIPLSDANSRSVSCFLQVIALWPPQTQLFLRLVFGCRGGRRSKGIKKGRQRNMLKKLHSRKLGPFSREHCRPEATLFPHCNLDVQVIFLQISAPARANLKRPSPNLRGLQRNLCGQVEQMRRDLKKTCARAIGSLEKSSEESLSALQSGLSRCFSFKSLRPHDRKRSGLH